MSTDDLCRRLSDVSLLARAILGMVLAGGDVTDPLTQLQCRVDSLKEDYEDRK